MYRQRRRDLYSSFTDMAGGTYTVVVQQGGKDLQLYPDGELEAYIGPIA
jgi:hypothetical protein